VVGGGVLLLQRDRLLVLLVHLLHLELLQVVNMVLDLVAVHRR